MDNLTLFGKSGCCLCDDARDLLALLQRELDATFTEHDILEREEWYAAYRHRIPVIMRDEVIVAEGRFDEQALRAALTDHAFRKDKHAAH